MQRNIGGGDHKFLILTALYVGCSISLQKK